METTTFTLRLTFTARVPIPREVVASVLENSTAMDAIEEGVWNWLPISEEDEDSTDSLLDVRLTLLDE